MNTPVDKQPNILVVDDEEIMLDSVQAILETYGYNCHLSSRGIEALEILKEHTIDIILLDLMMPDMNGHEVMTLVKQEYPKIDIIIISGETTFDSATQALRQGAKDFLAKPYKPDDLIKTIRHIEKTRNLEQMVENMNQQVKQSELRYRFYINNSPDIIFMLDQKGKFTFINERISQILEYTPQELIGKPVERIVSDADIPQVEYTINQINQFPEHKQIMETVLKKKSNNEIAYFDLELMAINQIYAEPVLGTNIAPSLNNETTNEQQQINSPEQIITGIYGVAREITEKKLYEEELTTQLYYDNLTQLPNRLLFIDRLNHHIPQAGRLEKPFAIIYLDIDRFRKINDSLGRNLGDQFLKRYSEILLSCLRSSDTLARVSSDSFLILTPAFKKYSDIEKLIVKIQDKFAEPILVDQQEIFVNSSFGIACYPEHGDQPDTLIKHAEMAMYYCKNTQPGYYQFFSTNYVNHFESSLSIENGIRKAIANNEFEVYFQPQIDIQSNQFYGVEALIRWNHPEKGLIFPDFFIPVAEESQLICDIGYWMIDNSMKIIQEWNKNPELRNIRLAINISANQFSQEDFCDQVLKSLERYQLQGRQIELEITENVVLENIDEVIKKLKILADHGIKFAIDDFGMGYSSLSYLQKLPLNNLKIDRAFISPIQEASDSNSIISAIVSMAKEMDMEIVVEGVESEIQLNYVKTLGCPIVQGYYFAKPMNVMQTKEYAISMLVN